MSTTVPDTNAILAELQLTGVSDAEFDRCIGILKRHPYLAAAPAKTLVGFLLEQGIQTSWLHHFTFLLWDQLAALIDDPEVLALHTQDETEVQGLFNAMAIAQGIAHLRGNPDLNHHRLEEFNRRYAFVRNFGNRARVVMRDSDGRAIAMPTHDWAKGYNNELIEHLVPKKRQPTGEISHYTLQQYKLGDWWLNHPERRTYNAVDFVPGGPELLPGGKLNLWAGWPKWPRQYFKRDDELVRYAGDCSLFLDFVFEVICGSNQDEYEWLLNWMAYAVQYPDRPAGVAVVLASPLEGIGKTLFGELFGLLFGAHFLEVSQPKHVTGNFNAHLAQSVLVVANEALFAGDLAQSDKLKAMLTDSTLMLEAKGSDAVSVRNCLHLIITSNHEQPVNASDNSRRFFVPSISGHRQKDREYFGRLVDSMHGSGAAALFRFLMNWPLNGWTPNDLLVTKRLETVRAASNDNPLELAFLDNLRESHGYMDRASLEADPKASPAAIVLPEGVAVPSGDMRLLLGLEREGKGALNRQARTALSALGFVPDKIYLSEYGRQVSGYRRGGNVTHVLRVEPCNEGEAQLADGQFVAVPRFRLTLTERL